MYLLNCFIIAFADVRTSKTPTEKESKQSSQSSRTSSRDEGKRSVSTREKERRRERRKKKKQSVPKLRKRMSKTGTTAEQYLQAILMSYFQALDPAGSGFISADDFWSVSTRLRVVQQFLICFKVWAKLAQQWFVCAPLGMHLEPKLMLLVTI